MTKSFQCSRIPSGVLMHPFVSRVVEALAHVHLSRMIAALRAWNQHLLDVYFSMARCRAIWANGRPLGAWLASMQERASKPFRHARSHASSLSHIRLPTEAIKVLRVPLDTLYTWQQRCHPFCAALHSLQDHVNFLILSRNSGGVFEENMPVRLGSIRDINTIRVCLLFACGCEVPSQCHVPQRRSPLLVANRIMSWSACLCCNPYGGRQDGQQG
eukprot:6080012-Amphidinium_carterae.1